MAPDAPASRHRRRVAQGRPCKQTPKTLTDKRVDRRRRPLVVMVVVSGRTAVAMCVEQLYRFEEQANTRH